LDTRAFFAGEVVGCRHQDMYGSTGGNCSLDGVPTAFHTRAPGTIERIHRALSL
jgi:hypothetical protein